VVATVNKVLFSKEMLKLQG